MNTTKTGLKFFSATATKRFALTGWEMIQQGQTVHVAKWNDLFVVATSEKNFAVCTAETASGLVKTLRDQNNKPLPSRRAPRITGTETQFTWRVEAGHTCPDGCCGDESPTFEKVCGGKDEALALASKLEKGDYKNPTAFVRVMGPAFYQKHWNRPAM
jgi:hypothetical protein